MPFTNAQKIDIRTYLGYPNTFQQSNPRLENSIEIAGQDPDVQAKIEGILAALDALENTPGQGLDASLSSAGIKKVDDEIEFFPTGSSSSLSSKDQGLFARGNALINKLSIILGVPIAHPYFSQKGYRNDDWSMSSRHSILPLWW